MSSQNKVSASSTLRKPTTATATATASATSASSAPSSQTRSQTAKVSPSPSTSSSSSASSVSATSSSTATASSTSSATRLPSQKTLMAAAKISIEEDKPIMLDYWQKRIIIVVKPDEKILYKSTEEYTSPIEKMYKVETEIIAMTQNSVYIILADTPTKNLATKTN
jgi:hypothetical protein